MSTPVTEAVALADPEVAVTVSVPCATDVTRPEEDTVATDELEVVYVTMAPLITPPLASFTMAVSCAVSAHASKVSVESDSTTLVAT